MVQVKGLSLTIGPGHSINTDTIVEIWIITIEPGRLCFGCAWELHTEHWNSNAARATSGRKPCCLKRELSLSGLGCPRFLWARMMAVCSSLGKPLNNLDCWGFIRSLSCDGNIVVDVSTPGDVNDAGGLWFSVAASWALLGGLSTLLTSAVAEEGLQANTVIFNRHAWEGRTNCRWARFSQCSQSASVERLPVVSVHIESSTVWGFSFTQFRWRG